MSGRLDESRDLWDQSLVTKHYIHLAMQVGGLVMVKD
jgi:hypothetical protein